MTKAERRIACAACRILQATDDETRYTALARLEHLVGWELAFPVWMATSPDPVLVQAVLDYRYRSILRSSMRAIVRLDTGGMKAAQQFQDSMTKLQRNVGYSLEQVQEVNRALSALAEEERM